MSIAIDTTMSHQAVMAASATTTNPDVYVVYADYNRDTGSVAITVKTDDGSTERVIFKQSLNAGQSLVYAKEAGFQVI